MKKNIIITLMLTLSINVYDSNLYACETDSYAATIFLYTAASRNRISDFALALSLNANPEKKVFLYLPNETTVHLQKYRINIYEFIQKHCAKDRSTEEMLEMLKVRESLRSCFVCFDQWENLTESQRYEILMHENNEPTH